MQRVKRQTKPPQEYVIPKACYPRKRKKYKKLERAQYEVIPAPMKFICIPNFYVVYSDIGLRTYQGSIHNYPRLLEQYFDVRKIEVLKEESVRKISLLMEKKGEVPVPAWQGLVEGLLASDNDDLRDWGTRIKNYSLKYEETQRALASDEVIINGYNEKELMEMAEMTENKVARYLKEYPCISYNFNTEKDTSTPIDVCFNEQYINKLGYSLEKFATTVLQEGFPSMMPHNTALSAKLLLDNYYNLGKDGVETPEILSDFVIKNDFKRIMRYKHIHLPSYKDRIYKVIGVIIILGAEYSVTKEEDEEMGELNEVFLNKIIKKENQTSKFMKMYYDKSLTLPYTNIHKICKIREIEIVKKEEEEECR